MGLIKDCEDCRFAEVGYEELPCRECKPENGADKWAPRENEMVAILSVREGVSVKDCLEMLKGFGFNVTFVGKRPEGNEEMTITAEAVAI